MVDQFTWDRVRGLVEANINSVISGLPVTQCRVVAVLSSEIQSSELKVEGDLISETPAEFDVQEFVWVNCSALERSRRESVKVEVTRSISVTLGKTVESTNESHTTISLDGTIGAITTKINHEMIEKTVVRTGKKETQSFFETMTEDVVENVEVGAWSKLTIKAVSTKGYAKIAVKGFATVDALVEIDYTVLRGRRKNIPLRQIKRVRLTDPVCFKVEPRHRTIEIDGFLNAESYSGTTIIRNVESLSTTDGNCSAVVDGASSIFHHASILELSAVG